MSAALLDGKALSARMRGRLGQEAAAAMDAECAAAMRKSDYALVDRLHQIARTSPAVLQAAGELIADPQNSMADGVLAGGDGESRICGYGRTRSFLPEYRGST